ncbi:hypothetical protein Tco_0958310 [Tanacetum coccineum]
MSVQKQGTKAEETRFEATNRKNQNQKQNQNRTRTSNQTETRIVDQNPNQENQIEETTSRNQIGNESYSRVYGLGGAVVQDNNVVTVIVCHEKHVRVPYKNEVLVVQGLRSGVRIEYRLSIISCIKTQKYIEKGCPVFLIQVTKKGTEEKQLKDLSIVRHFSEVFPEDLHGLPPARQVEFKIDLVPGAAPVVRAPYRLAPAEMKELSDQLKELSDKGFIRPSSLPWGAPVLFVKKKDGSFRMCIDYRLAGYYWRFIKGFSKIAKSLTMMTQKNKMFDWEEEHEATFKLLKQKIYDAPILALPEGSDDFEGEIKPLRVRALVMTINLNLPSQILEARNKAVKAENIKFEDLGGMIKKLEPHSDRTLCLKNISWLPYFGDLRNFGNSTNKDIAISYRKLMDKAKGQYRR